MKVRQSLIAVFVSVVAAGTTQATVISGNSRFFNSQEVLTIFNTSPPNIIDSGPVDELTGTAPSPYTLIGTDTVVESNVDGGAGFRFARAAIDAPDTNFVINLNIDNPSGSLMFEFTASGIKQSANVTSGFGNLVATGGVLFDSVTATVNGNPLAVPIDPAPNTVLVNEVIGDDSLVFILNKQTLTGDGITNRGIEVTAISYELSIADDNGNPEFNSASDSRFTSASLTAVPEPSSLALLGLGGLLLARRRR